MPTDLYIKSGSGVAEFQSSHLYSTGDRMVPARADTSSYYKYARGWVWECTTGGTSVGTPTWPWPITQDVSTATSGGATFTARWPGFPAGGSPDWSFATPYFDYPFSTEHFGLSGGGSFRVFVSANHNQNTSASPNYQMDFSGSGTSYTNILCVDDSAAPPTQLATGAVVGINSMQWDHWAYAYGIHFKMLSSTLMLQQASGIVAENCIFELAHATAAYFYFTNAIAPTDFRNCTLKFGSTAQGISGTYSGADNGQFRWSGGGLAADSAAIVSLFPQGLSGSPQFLENLDLSHAATGFVFVTMGGNNPTWETLLVRNCRMPAGWSGDLTDTTVGVPAIFEAHNIVTLGDYWRKGRRGTIREETTHVRTGGATIARKMQSDTNASWALPLETGDISIYAASGSEVTAAVEILHDSETALTNADVWIDVSYLSSASYPLGAIASNRLADKLDTPTAHASSSATWDQSELTNPNKQKLTVAFTPLAAGYITLRVVLALASKTLYFDPKVTLT